MRKGVWNRKINPSSIEVKLGMKAYLRTTNSCEKNQLILRGGACDTTVSFGMK